MDRNLIVNELLTGCPDDALADYQKIAAAIKRGDSKDEILSMKEVNDWPETYFWLKTEL